MFCCDRPGRWWFGKTNKTPQKNQYFDRIIHVSQTNKKKILPKSGFLLFAQKKKNAQKHTGAHSSSAIGLSLRFAAGAFARACSRNAAACVWPKLRAMSSGEKPWAEYTAKRAPDA